MELIDGDDDNESESDNTSPGRQRRPSVYNELQRFDFRFEVFQ